MTQTKATMKPDENESYNKSGDKRKKTKNQVM